MARPIIVTALFGQADNGWLQDMRRAHFPPERNQVPAHLTLFHQLPSSIEDELTRRLVDLARLPPPQAIISGIMDLGTGTAFRVESPQLTQMREGLAQALHGLLGPQDRSPWSPHITIQNKVPPREAAALQKQLQALFQPRPLAINGLATWRYLDGPWDPIRTHIFRG